MTTFVYRFVGFLATAAAFLGVTSVCR